MDLVVRAPRLPAPGETLLGGSYRTFPGGKGANQAVAAARLGARVSLVGAIGDDPHGVKLRATLEAEGIDLTHLRVRAGEFSGLALITVAEGGENTIVVAPGANATLTAEEVRASASAIMQADTLLIQLEIPTAAVVEAARIAREGGRAVVLNAAPGRVLPAELLRMVDALVVNRTEAAILAGLDAGMDPARLALRLPDLGPPSVLLTLGEQGSILVHRGRPRRVPTIRVKAVDAVGAGDAFAAGLAAAWGPVHAAAKIKSPDEFRLVEAAALRASVAGALATTKPGAIPSLPTRAEVDAAAAELAVGT